MFEQKTLKTFVAVDGHKKWQQAASSMQQMQSASFLAGGRFFLQLPHSCKSGQLL